jgi:hypothetical protein
MGERLASGNVAIALLANTLATGAMLVALILALGPISGAHLNPAVTLARAASDTFAGIRSSDAPWIHRRATHRGDGGNAPVPLARASKRNTHAR